MSLQFIGLSADGAHYALYGVHLSWGYIDHPPLIGWLQAFWLFVFGQHDWSIHITPILSSILSLCVLTKLYQLLNHDIHKTYSLALFCFISVVFNALTFLSLTQMPLILLGLLALYFFWQYSTQPNISNALLFGLCLGLAGLADYTSFLVLLGVIIYILIYQRTIFLSFYFYLSLLIALILISPFLLWNAQHHWISFTAGYHHSFSGTLHLTNFYQGLFIQLLGYSPILTIYGIYGGFHALLQRKPLASLLALPGLIIIFAFTYASLHHRIFFHWTALGWVLLAPLSLMSIKKYWRHWWTKLLFGFSLILSINIYSVFYSQLFFGFIKFPLAKNPLIDLYGWQQIAITANQLKTKNHVNMLLVPNWSLASRLSWYANGPVQIIQPSTIAGYLQFEQWYGKFNAKHTTGILVVPFKWHRFMNTNDSYLNHCHLLKTQNIIVYKNITNQIDFYLCKPIN